MIRWKVNATAWLAVVLAVYTGCAQEKITQEMSRPVVAAPFQELYDQGIDQYLGAFAPTSSVEVSPGVTEHSFGGMGGPVCYTGNRYSMFTRDGRSDALLIFLQGGGFCGPNDCQAVATGIPLIPFGILNPSDPANPTADFNLGYVPYCDGSGMIGDREVADSSGGALRSFRGAQNLSASLDVIVGRYPAPSKIVLAGNSAGGFAVHTALPLVRKLYPGVPIDLINDSGLGIANPGSMQGLFDHWNGAAFFPSSCSDCIGTDGNLTDYHKYQLAEDPHLRMAYISSRQDATFASLLAGGGEAFEEQVLEAAGELKMAFPDRFNYLIADGNGHTFLISDFGHPIGGTTVKQWVEAMVSENGNWDSVKDQ